MLYIWKYNFVGNDKSIVWGTQRADDFDNIKSIAHLVEKTRCDAKSRINSELNSQQTRSVSRLDNSLSWKYFSLTSAAVEKCNPMTYASRLQRTRGREGRLPEKAKEKRGEKERDLLCYPRRRVARRETALGFWYASSPSSHSTWRSDLCGTGSPRAPRGGAHSNPGWDASIFFSLLLSLRPRARPHAPDVARDATLFATRGRGCDLGHEREGTKGRGHACTSDCEIAVGEA